MFNDRYGLTAAVLLGCKTMTRRLMPMTLHKNGKEMNPVVPDDMFVTSDGIAYFQVGHNGYRVPKENQPVYKVGEEIAIAQPYKQCWDIYQKQWESYNDPISMLTPAKILGRSVQETAGWVNKMFVKAEYMPHTICIKSIKAERLQDISEEDCLREGIVRTACVAPYGFTIGNGKWKCYRTPRDAFSTLIDKVCKRGTWNSNPWVFAYEFELLR